MQRIVEGQLATFTVRRAGDIINSVSVKYRSIDGEASSLMKDFLPISGTLVFGAGQREKAIVLQTLEDSLPEGDETLILELYEATGDLVVFGNKTGRLIIAANDQAGGVFRFAPPLVKTGREGAITNFE